MRSKRSRNVFIAFSVVMVIAMASSVILPLLQQQTAQQTDPQEEPTQIPSPTPPTMPQDPASTIDFASTYLHPSGLFTVAQPAGWTPAEEVNTGVEAKVSMRNPTYQSVIEASLEAPSEMPDSPEALSDYFTDQWLSSSWRNYTSWEESTRRVEGDRVIIDFTVTLGRRTLIARQVSWTDGQWIYNARAVTPQNGVELLRFLLDRLADSIDPLESLASSPTGWTSYFDTQDRHILRYPTNWSLADAAPGLPASIVGDDTVLRVEAHEGRIEDAAAARQWVESTRSGVEALETQPVEREGASGFAVSYSFRTVDGAPQSGMAVLLNGPAERFHVANLRFDAADVNLLSEEGSDGYRTLRQVLDTFRLKPDLSVSVADAAGGETQPQAILPTSVPSGN